MLPRFDTFYEFKPRGSSVRAQATKPSRSPSHEVRGDQGLLFLYISPCRSPVWHLRCVDIHSQPFEFISRPKIPSQNWSTTILNTPDCSQAKFQTCRLPATANPTRRTLLVAATPSRHTPRNRARSRPARATKSVETGALPSGKTATRRRPLSQQRESCGVRSDLQPSCNGRSPPRMLQHRDGVACGKKVSRVRLAVTQLSPLQPPPLSEREVHYWGPLGRKGWLTFCRLIQSAWFCIFAEHARK